MHLRMVQDHLDEKEGSRLTPAALCKIQRLVNPLYERAIGNLISAAETDRGKAAPPSSKSVFDPAD